MPAALTSTEYSVASFTRYLPTAFANSSMKPCVSRSRDAADHHVLRADADNLPLELADVDPLGRRAHLQEHARDGGGVVEDRAEHQRDQIVALLGREGADEAEIQEAERPLVVDQDVPGVGIAVEEAVDEHALAHRVDDLFHRVLGLGRCSGVSSRMDLPSK